MAGATIPVHIENFQVKKLQQLYSNNIKIVIILYDDNIRCPLSTVCVDKYWIVLQLIQIQWPE